MGFKPLHDRVLLSVLRLSKKQLAASSFQIAQEKPQQGKVVSVGTGTGNDNGSVTPLTVGDTILFGKWSGMKLLEGKEYLIMKESDISVFLLLNLIK